MGTSKSYSGPLDNPKPAPGWSSPDASSDGIEIPPGGDAEQEPEQPLEQETDNTESVHLWRAAKSTLTSALRSKDYAKAGHAYVKAMGGSRAAARSASSSARSTTRLAGFLAALGTSGLGVALESHGLSKLIGQSANTVLAAVIDALAPAGGKRDDAIARDAMIHAFEELIQRYLDANDDLSGLEQLNEADLSQIVCDSIVWSVYLRWLSDLGDRIERGAISDNQAVRLEKEMLGFIRATARLDTSRVDVLNTNWQGSQGRQIIDGLYRAAYSFLENAA